MCEYGFSSPTSSPPLLETKSDVFEPKTQAQVKLCDDEAEEASSESDEPEEVEEEVNADVCSKKDDQFKQDEDYEEEKLAPKKSLKRRLHRVDSGSESEDSDLSEPEMDGDPIVIKSRRVLVIFSDGESIALAVASENDVKSDVFRIVAKSISGSSFDPDVGIKSLPKRHGAVGRQANQYLLKLYNRKSTNIEDLDSDGLDMKFYGGQFSRTIVLKID